MSNIIQFPTSGDHLLKRGIDLLGEGKVNEALDTLDEAFELAQDETLRVQIISLFIEVCLGYKLDSRLKTFWQTHFENKEDILSHLEYQFPYFISLSLIVPAGHETLSELYFLKENITDSVLLEHIDSAIQRERHFIDLLDEIQKVTSHDQMKKMIDTHYDQSIDTATLLLRVGEELESLETKELFYLEMLKHEMVSPFVKQIALSDFSKINSLVEKHPTIEYEWFGEMKTVHLNTLFQMHEDPIFLQGLALMTDYFDENNPHLAMEALELYEHCYSFIYPFGEEIIGDDIDSFVDILLNPENITGSKYQSLMELIEMQMFILFEGPHSL